MERKTYPLSFIQRMIGYTVQLYPKTAVSIIGGLLLVEDELDFELLQKAIKLCVARNDSLRLRLIKPAEDADLIMEYLVYGSIRQYITDEQAADIPLIDFSAKTQQEMDDEILRWNSSKIDVYEQPLYDFKMVKSCDGRHGVFCKIDHLAIDAWSSVMIGTEVVDLYYALKKGEELPKPYYSFLEYLDQEQAYYNSPRYKEDEAFWFSLYEKEIPKTFISDRDKYTTTSGKSDRKTVLLDKETTSAIKAFCANASLSPSNFFQIVLGTYLYQQSGSQDVLFGNSAAMRSTLREKRTCGVMANNISVRLQLDENKPFADVCAESNLQLMTMMRHMYFPQLFFSLLIRPKLKSPYLMDSYIAYHVARIQTREKVPCQMTWYTSGGFGMEFYFNVTDLDDAGRYLLYYEYQTEALSPKRVDEVHDGLLSIVHKGLEHPDIPLKRL